MEQSKGRIDLNGFFERLSYQGLFQDLEDDMASKYIDETWSDDSTEASISNDSVTSSQASSPSLRVTDWKQSQNPFFGHGYRLSETNCLEASNAQLPFSNITNQQGISSNCNFGKNVSINFTSKNQNSNTTIQQKFQCAKKQMKIVRLAKAVEIILSQPLDMRFSDSIKTSHQQPLIINKREQSDQSIEWLSKNFPTFSQQNSMSSWTSETIELRI